MKNLRVLLVLTSALFCAVFTKAQTGDPQAEYARAVRAYVDASTEELRSARGLIDSQVATMTDGSGKKRYDAVFAKLDECDKLLTELKKSGPNNFDNVKLKFEQARRDLTKLIDATKSQSPAPMAPDAPNAPAVRS